MIRKHLLKCFNRYLDEDIQEDCLNSKTTMIPKNKTPLILEHRPIAVMVLKSKVLCTFYREKIEEHLKECSYGYENQYGFTRGGRVEHCLFILNYISNMTFESGRKEHKSLFLGQAQQGMPSITTVYPVPCGLSPVCGKKCQEF